MKMQLQAISQVYLSQSLYPNATDPSVAPMIETPRQNAYTKSVNGIIVSYCLKLELSGSTLGAEYNCPRCSLFGEYLPVIKSSLALGTAEAVLMPLTTKCLDILANHSRLAHLAFGRTTFGSLRLAVNTPRVPVLFDMRHAVLERVATLGTEEVPVMPMRSKSYNVLPEDGGFAVLTAWSEEFVPVEMAVEAEAFISVFRHGHARLLIQNLSRRATPNSVQSLSPRCVWLWRNLHGLKASVASVATEAVRMEPLRGTSQCHKFPFNRTLTLIAESPCSATGGSCSGAWSWSWGPVTPRSTTSWCRKRARASYGRILWRRNAGNLARFWRFVHRNGRNIDRGRWSLRSLFWFRYRDRRDARARLRSWPRRRVFRHNDARDIHRPSWILGCGLRLRL